MSRKPRKCVIAGLVTTGPGGGCISALYFTATLFVGLKERKKGAVAASAVCLIITIASFFI